MPNPTKLYPTKPLQCWQKCKELRLAYYRDVAAAREQGKLLVAGSAWEALCLPSGLGDYVFFGGEPYGASIASDMGFARRCAEATESTGLAREMCAHMRNFLGSAYLDSYLFGGKFPRLDFSITFHICDSHAKWYQHMYDRWGVPFFAIDLPAPDGAKRREERIEYLASQLWDAIEWMEKVSGRPWDDEKFIQGVVNNAEAVNLFSQVLMLNRAVPAPLDMKSLLSLYLPAALVRQTSQAVAFYRELRDEVEERVKSGIAALATERFRFFHDSQPPWYFLKLFRLLEQRGAVCVGSLYLATFANFREDGDGNWVPFPTPAQSGLALRNREDAVRFSAEWVVDSPLLELMGQATHRSARLLQLMKEYRAEGMVMHLNRGCKGTAQAQLEGRLALQEAGFPVATYEGNMADPREFDEAQVVDRLEAFMESLGLDKIAEDSLTGR